MPMYPLFFVIAALIGWNVVPLRRALLTTTAFGFGLSALLAITWTIWDDPWDDVAWLLWLSLTGTTLLVAVTGIAYWVKTTRSERLAADR